MILDIEKSTGHVVPPAADIVERLKYWVEVQPDNDAFIFLVDGEEEEVQLTYRELDRRACAMAQQLTEMGLRGERALLLYPPGLDFVIAFYGCLYAGVIVVPAYPPKRNRNMQRIQAISDDAQASVALTTEDVLLRTIDSLEEAPHLEALTWRATDKMDTALGENFSPVETCPDDLAVLQYTSGSTGAPKGVMISRGNMFHNTQLITHGFAPNCTHGGLTWLPTYHDMGLVGGVLQPVSCGLSNVLMSPLAFLQKPVRWLRGISRHKVVISGGPNFAYQLCVDKITPEQMEGLDLSRWDVAFNGAEPIRPDTLAAFTEKFAPVGFHADAHYPCYGMAETTLIITGGVKQEGATVRHFDGKKIDQRQVRAVEESDANARSLVGCGAALPEMDIVIVEPETCRLLPDDKIGEIWVRGASVALGYWRNEEATEATFGGRILDSEEGPYLRTGDLGFIDEGQVFVTGRLKDLIIIRGVNRYPQDIEKTVEKAHDKLTTGGVAAFSTDVDGRERLVVVAETERDRGIAWNEAIDAVRRKVTSEHELPPDAVILVRHASLPKTSSGKIQRYACRQDFINGTFRVVEQWQAWSSDVNGDVGKKDHRPTAIRSFEGAIAPAGELPSDRVLRIVMEEVHGIAKGRAAGLHADSNIVELGLDSLERVEIIAELEELFGGRLPEEILPDIETCREVAEAVEKFMGTEPKARSARPRDYEVPASFYRFEEMPEYHQLKAQETLLMSTGMPNPFFAEHQRVSNETTVIDGKELINFSSFNYLGMSGEERISAAAKKAIDQYGTSVSASRLVSGEKTLHRELERTIADFVGVESAIVYVSGHSTNVNTIGHLMGPGDLIVHDALAHNSIVQGSLLSGARRRPFPHNDYEALDNLLADIRHEYRRVLVAVEGVYSMDGDYPDLPKLIEVKERHKAFLLVDEAHSIGTMGPHGRGLGEHFEIDPRSVDLWMGALSKALGSSGGYIAGCKEVIEYLKYTAPGFVFSTGISPPNAAAALASMQLLEEEPDRVARVIANSQLFLRLAREKGLNTGLAKGTPVVPIIIGNSLHALVLSRRMFEQGVNVQPILHPAVEEKAARLRFFISSNHSEEQIRKTIDLLAQELGKVDSNYQGLIDQPLDIPAVNWVET